MTNEVVAAGATVGFGSSGAWSCPTMFISTSRSRLGLSLIHI